MEYKPTQQDYDRVSYQAVRCAVATIMSAFSALSTVNGDPLIDSQRLYKYLQLVKDSLNLELLKRIKECNVKGEYVDG